MGSAAIPAYFGYEYSIAHKAACEFSGIEKEGFPKSPEAQGVYYETFDCFQERRLLGRIARIYKSDKPAGPSTEWLCYWFNKEVIACSNRATSKKILTGISKVAKLLRSIAVPPTLVYYTRKGILGGYAKNREEIYIRKKQVEYLLPCRRDVFESVNKEI